MANEAVNRSLNIYIESGQAQKVYDTLIAKEKQLNEQLAKTTDPKAMKALQDQLTKLQEPISRAAKKLSGELQPSLRDSQALARQLNNELSREFDPKKAQQLREVNALIKQQKAEINGLAQAQNGISKENGFTRMLDTAKGFVAGNLIMKAGQLVTDFFKGTITEAIEANESSEKFRTTLENIGRSDAFERLTDAADEMQQRFRYLDNDDIVGVFNKLIDYGKLTETQIKQLTPVIIDFAGKQKISLADASSTIIKALAGNGKGLKEYGISLDGTKTIADRFNVVMTTLKDKVDGAGEAFQNSAAGGIATTKQSMKDLQEQIGTGLLPAYTRLLDWTNKLITGFKYLADKIGDVFDDVTAFFTDGIGGVAANWAQREAETIMRRNKNIVNNLVREFETKTEDEVADKIIELQNRIAERQSFLEKAKANKSGIFDKDDVENSKKVIALLRMELDALFKLQDSRGRNLGITQDDAEETDKNLKKILADFKELQEALDALKRQRLSDFWSPLDKEVSDTDQKFKKLRELAHGNRDKLKQIDQEYYDQLFSIQLKYSRLELQEYFRLKKEQEQRAQELVNKLAALGLQTGTNDKLKGIMDLAGQDAAAAKELEILQATGKRKLDLQKQQLKEEEDAEIRALENEAYRRGTTEDAIQNMIALKREQFRQKQQQLDVQYYAQLAGTIIGYVQQALQVVSQINELQNQKENAQLEAYQERNERKKKSLDNTLEAGMITQLEHDREVQRLEKEQERREKEIKKRQFRRNQALSITQASINGAMAVTNALATVQPFFYAAIAAAAAAAVATTAEVAFIAAQKPPEYAKGGKLGGQSHADGGNAIIDSKTGRKIGEIEHDEGIINKHSMRDKNSYTVSGTPSQIASLINRLGGGVHWEPGARLVPAWRTVKPAAINTSNIQRYYAAGGTFTASTASKQANVAQESGADMIQTIDGMKEAVKEFSAVMSEIKRDGITSYAILTQQEKQQARLDSIRNDATMKG